MADRKHEEIRGLALFQGCSASDVRWVATVADTVDVPEGRTIARAGDRVREFVVLVEGCAASSDGHEEVALLPGSHLGPGLLDDDRHPATVTTSSGVRLLVFSAGAFRGLLDRMPSVGRRLLAGRVAPLRSAQPSRSLRAVS